MIKLLLIEDDPLVARMYQKIFDENGFDSDIAYDGDSGLKMMRDSKPDLVLLDIMLPGINGMEVLQLIKTDESLKSIQVIMLTNLVGVYEKEALTKGALAYIVKGEYLPADIVQIVKKKISKS